MLFGTSHPRWTRVFAPLVWLAILQVLVFALIASSPELHEFVHTDAHESGHYCLSTDFQSGSLDQALVAPIVAPDFQSVPVACAATPTEVRLSLPVHLCGSLLEHGPPAFA